MKESNVLFLAFWGFVAYSAYQFFKTGQKDKTSGNLSNQEVIQAARAQTAQPVNMFGTTRVPSVTLIV